MWIFRNREARVLTIAGCILVPGAAALLWALFGAWAGMAVAGICALLWAVAFGLMHARYRSLRILTRKLDAVLHQGAPLSVNQYEEGDFALLQDEIYKMTVRLQEQAQLLKAEREALADSMADISHQLKTPLTSLTLIAQLLQQPECNGARHRELCADLKAQLLRMEWLVSALLKLARLDAGTVSFHPELVTAQQLFHSACEPLFIPMELRGQNLRADCPAECKVVCDLSWTAEALGNVVKNCMEHAPLGGEVRVQMRQTPLFFEAVVEDNGPGILPEDLPHLFERFYHGRAQENGQSVGIGLAFARTVLSAQNGTIRAENRRDGGARFVLRIYSATV